MKLVSRRQMHWSPEERVRLVYEASAKQNCNTKRGGSDLKSSMDVEQLACFWRVFWSGHMFSFLFWLPNHRKPNCCAPMHMMPKPFKLCSHTECISAKTLQKKFPSWTMWLASGRYLPQVVSSQSCQLAAEQLVTISLTYSWLIAS